MVSLPDTTKKELDPAGEILHKMNYFYQQTFVKNVNKE